VTQIRPAVVDDAAAIAEMHVRSWQAGYRGLLPDDFLAGLSVDDRRRRWTERLGDPNGTVTVLVAEPDGHIRGFVSFGPSRDPGAPPEVGELIAIYVDPAYWRHHLGSTLHQRAIEMLTAQGFREATLWVLAGNERACAFYEQAGWVADGVTKTEPWDAVTIREVRYRRQLSA
jgi:GNAT superfamily N-acetyltransferase